MAAGAGRTVIGTRAVCEALKAGRVFLVVEASGNSDNTAKRIRDRCAYYGIRLVKIGADSAALGAALGRAGPAAAAGVTDRSLAAAVLASMERAGADAGTAGDAGTDGKAP
jgi:ribosomal protein L7Ae-like RNA K-turn-binding protein